MREKVITRIEPNVTVIPKLQPMPRRKRVAAYARVSTSSDEQMESIEAQRDYYSKYIAANAQWDFVGIYADEGISGTSSNRRQAFKQMVDDALAGKIDLILTKSLSRFARNTVDTLKTIRALKEKGVEVYFEKEDISTLDSKGEFLITLMSSLAQEESRSISENVAWGIRKRFADGKFSMPYKIFLGYDRGDDGTMVINADQAEIVRLIYLLYLEGRTLGDIKRVLMGAGIKTVQGKDRWHVTVLENILTNEKYYGAALLQKKFTYDFLTKKAKKNCGELPQYYIEDDHPPIVSKAQFDAVQERLAVKERQRCTRSPFAGKLRCGHCHQIYTRKHWHTTTTNDVVWECPQRFQGNPKCPTPHIYEPQLTEAYQRAFINLLEANPCVVEYCRMVLKDHLSAERYEDAIEYLTEAIPQDWAELSYDPAMWLTLVEQVTVRTDQKLLFRFIDGYETVIVVPKRTRPTHKRIPAAVPDDTASDGSKTLDDKIISMTEGVTEMEPTAVKKERRRLSEHEKQMIIVLKLKGYGSKRIAGQLGLNPSAVKTFIHRHGDDTTYTAALGLCPCCGVPLVQTPGARAKKYCSDACRLKWWAQHQDQMDRTLYTITCIQCGRSFETANPRRKFCGRSCYAESRRKEPRLP
ncbi:MAG: hypothetical protein E7459_09090 [Ruminococcaceae bacterium]|nr:hypothetical protein [Oscillospiraceae bacterium]